MKVLLLAAFLLVGPLAGARNIPSAIRKKGESWLDHAKAYSKELNNPASAYERRVKWDELVFTIVPTWESRELVDEAFQKVRDTRFLDDPSVSSFLRRLSWLYPDDGCFMRAAFMSQMIEKVYSKQSARIFIFGDLYVETENSPEGRVDWWYHTAPLIKFAEDVYVFDPAINSSGVTEIKKWIQKQSVTLSEAELSVCDANAYEPGEACEGSDSDEDTALQHAPWYLQLERERQVELQRNPEEVLGEHPPWLVI